MTMKSRGELELRGPEIDLTGPDGNAYALLAYAKGWAKDLSLDWEEILKDMKSSDYEHLLEVLEKNFGEYVVFYR